VGRVSETAAVALLVALLSVASLSHSIDPRPSKTGAVRVHDRKERDWAEIDKAAHRLRDGKPLDPNQASAAELRLLPGIGPALSQRIVADRRLHGPFGRIDDLTRVRGIGPKTVERLRPLLRPERTPVEADSRRDGGAEVEFRDD
jgi:competence ComEA-like helix-hairpin-helix protein